MDSVIATKISKYAKVFAQKKFIESGYIALRDGDGIVITVTKADLNNIGENDVVFVNDKNIESFEGNFRAAAVILFCAIRQDKVAETAAIVDSEAILKYSSKRKPLQPVLDGVAHLLGNTVKSASKNVAAEVVTSLSGYRNACFMPDAGAVVKARSFDELVKAVSVLDKACNADMLAEDKGGTQHINPVTALFEQVVYKMKTSKAVEAQNADKTSDAKNSEENGNTDADVIQEKNPQNENEDYIERMTMVDGKILALACPIYVATVAAIGKPMIVTDEFKDSLGEEIACLPSKSILSDKALAKVMPAMNGAEICFMAQHGVLIVANDKDDLNTKLNKVESACEAYFKA